MAKQVRENKPLQLSFPFALWTLAMVGELIRREVGVRLSEVSVERMLRMLGFSPQRPLKRAYEQDSAVLVEQWRSEALWQIRRQAKREGGKIFFADEAGVRSDADRGGSSAPTGRTPVVERAGTRFSLNMFSAISAQGKMRFMVHEGTATAETFCEFLKRLATGVEDNIFLIVDSYRIDRAKKVQALQGRMNGQITLPFLPPYLLQLNPDDWVWNPVKQRVSKRPARHKAELKERVLAALRSLQRLRVKIPGFFRDPNGAYAAAVS